jgi:bifunctional non-homologous end joining protein LigD
MKSAGRKTRAGKGAARVAVAGVALSHPDRVYWDDAGITKHALAAYYARVWKRMAPHIVNRSVSLVRCPKGTRGQCFFQKHVSAGVETEFLRIVPQRGSQSFIAVRGLRGLIALVQAGTLEIHAWGTTCDRLDTCDRLVFDLDPGPGVSWNDVTAGAREVRDRLAKMGLKCFPKTTGGKGIHVVAPLAPTDWDEARLFARKVARVMARDMPQRYTANMAKDARQHRVFIDYARNARGATTIAPYSTRAKPGAPVAMPLSWSELGNISASNAFTLRNVMKRLAQQRGDPWAGIGRIRQKLPNDAFARR